MKVRILRQKTPYSEPYWEAFDYEGSRDISVAGMLDRLNYSDDIINDAGEKTGRIGWNSSCQQGLCGACAMVICGMPALACETFLKDIRSQEIVLQPLRKFPVVHDLIVDRSIIYENLKKTDIYIGEYRPGENEDLNQQYNIAKCLKCGLCMEICPNFTGGEDFYGAVYANDCYLVSGRNRERAGDIRKAYAEHFGNGCSKSFSCMDVCPVRIQTIASIAKMNKG